MRDVPVTFKGDNTQHIDRYSCDKCKRAYTRAAICQNYGALNSALPCEFVQPTVLFNMALKAVSLINIHIMEMFPSFISHTFLHYSEVEGRNTCYFVGFKHKITISGSCHSHKCLTYYCVTIYLCWDECILLIL